MGWTIANLDNTIKITKKCQDDLQLVALELGILYDESDKVVRSNKIYFDIDAMEHMDFIHNDEILEVLKKHKVNGRITFGSLDGDNAGKFWGYEFKDGMLTNLKGKIIFEEVKK